VPEECEGDLGGSSCTGATMAQSKKGGVEGKTPLSWEHSNGPGHVKGPVPLTAGTTAATSAHLNNPHRVRISHYEGELPEEEGRTGSHTGPTCRP
jgi:hypothetical protein